MTDMSHGVEAIQPAVPFSPVSYAEPCLPESKPSRHAPPTPTQLIPASQNSTPLSPIEVSGQLKRESEPRLALALCALLVALTCPDSPRSSLPSQTTKHTKYKRHRPLRNLVCDQTGFVLLLLRLSSRLLSLIYLLSPSSIGTSAHRSFRPGLGTSLTHAAKRAQDSPLPFPPNLLGDQFFVGSRAIADPSHPQDPNHQSDRRPPGTKPHLPLHCPDTCTGHP